MSKDKGKGRRRKERKAARRKKNGRNYTVVTYATHAHGRFAALETEKRGIVVGGWGKPWNGFMDKAKFYHEVAGTVPPDHVLIFIDGFDTHILREPQEAVNRFIKEFPGCRFLASVDLAIAPPFARRRMFGCTDPAMPGVNAGLYMGYAADVRRVLGACLRLGIDDDQQALQQVFESGRYGMCIDETQRVFCNAGICYRVLGGAAPDAVFVGYPGGLDAQRVLRGALVLYREVGSLAIGLALGVGYAVRVSHAARVSHAGGVTTSGFVRLLRVVSALAVLVVLYRNYADGALGLVAGAAAMAVFAGDLLVLLLGLLRGGG